MDYLSGESYHRYDKINNPIGHQMVYYRKNFTCTNFRYIFNVSTYILQDEMV